MSEMFLANAGEPIRKPLNLGLLGFGTVGSSFAEVLHAAKRPEIRITRVFNREVERKRTHARAQFVGAECVWTERIDDILAAEEIDAVVELTGGTEPTEAWLVAALRAGK